MRTAVLALVAAGMLTGTSAAPACAQPADLTAEAMAAHPTEHRILHDGDCWGSLGPGKSQ